MFEHWRTMGLCFCVAILLHGCRPPTSPALIGEKEQETAPQFPTSSHPDIVVADPDFERLTLDQFQVFQGDEGTWTKKGDLLICSGLPQGYLYSRESYRNFTLRGEFQFVLTVEQKKKPEQVTTGILIAIQPPHEIWPGSIKVEGSPERLGSIHSLGDRPPVAVSDQESVREQVRLPPDQWNTFEIVVRDGAVTSRLNGETVCTSQAGEVKEGLIGFQSDGYVVRFQNLRLRRDDASAPLPKPITP